jgi:hypothetical protein
MVRIATLLGAEQAAIAKIIAKIKAMFSAAQTRAGRAL